ncbi:SEC-C metal-binding domain-containing protein [Methanolobus sp. ZRKC5]|uniref:SEC-C metal-binding domain-containing protein n=1 Tax=unclassified Methanolobus TaxID=2629569 RepID=UPI00313AD38C
MADKIGRNDPCPCGSGKKYKKCCMFKDKEEKKSFMERTESTYVSSCLPGHDKYVFESKEEILESIRNAGFEPVAIENTFDDKGETFTNLKVDLFCKHGHSEIERLYILEDDGKWELIEEGWGAPCPECEENENKVLPSDSRIFVTRSKH